MYKIVRSFFNSEKAPRRRVVKTKLTLEEAMAHCQGPESSYKTCKKYRNRKRTEMYGPWYDTYVET